MFAKFKKMLRYIFWGLAFNVLFCMVTSLAAAEEDKGLVVIDRNPWKVSWIQESNFWILLINFDKGELKTFFDKTPPNKGLGIYSKNKPIKQEFKYYPAGRTFVSKKCQFEQWLDGAKGWAFIYDDLIKTGDNQFFRCSTAIIEEVNNAPDELRYSLFRKLE